MNYDFNPKDFPGFIDTSEITSAILDGKARLIERCLIGSVEQIEGRVPSVPEIRRYARRDIFPDGREVFMWKDSPILEVPADPMKIEEGKVTFTIKTVFRE